MTGDDMQADVGVIGLAAMGRNVARNLASRGFRVAVYNRNIAKTNALIETYRTEGDFRAAATLNEFVRSLRHPRQVIIMVKAGGPTDAVIEDLMPLLTAGDIVIDGGNAHFMDTRRREALLAKAGLRFLGTGISGGEQGALSGASIMPGGDPGAYADAAPVLTAIAAKVDGAPCCAWIGPDGAGHFVKMVHNGIEYADMQLIGEAYAILRNTLAGSPADIAQIFATWSSTDLDSYLIEITAEVLARIDGGTGRAFVDVVRDGADQKGTGVWTVEAALTAGIPATAIAEAVFARMLSGASEQRRAMRAAVAGALKPSGSRGHFGDPVGFIEDVRRALYAAKLVVYAQGFDLMRAASDEYHWDIDLESVATIWRGGCIIRARLLERIREALAIDPQAATLLSSEYFRASLLKSQQPWRRTVSHAILDATPAPAFASTLAYFDSLCAERLPTALIQGQRDFFGAHTYRRVDREGSFHLDWSSPHGTEHVVEVVD
jgi:6-phosphogluconate dehydrogenase